MLWSRSFTPLELTDDIICSRNIFIIWHVARHHMAQHTDKRERTSFKYYIYRQIKINVTLLQKYKDTIAHFCKFVLQQGIVAEGMLFVLTPVDRSKSHRRKVQRSFQKRERKKRKKEMQRLKKKKKKELELNTTLLFSLRNASFSKTCNRYNSDILTLSVGINSLQLTRTDRHILQLLIICI